MPFSV